MFGCSKKDKLPIDSSETNGGMHLLKYVSQSILKFSQPSDDRDSKGETSGHYHHSSCHKKTLH